jgi:hypothetical protein
VPISEQPKMDRRRFLAISAYLLSISASGLSISAFVRDWLQSRRGEAITGSGGLVFGWAITGSVRIEVRPASMMIYGHAPEISVTAASTGEPERLPFGAPVELRRALWEARIHPKKQNAVAAGRLRWNRQRFPWAPAKWIT